MKIGVLQLNPVVGDLEGNAEKISAAVRQAAMSGADFCLTSEMAVTGYPPQDMLRYEGFVKKARIMSESLAKDLADSVPFLLGNVDKDSIEDKKGVCRCAQWCRDGAIRHTFRTPQRPTYYGFDTAHCEPAPENDDATILEFQGMKIGVTIGEDAWNDKDYKGYEHAPLGAFATHKPDMIVNLSASPFFLGKQPLRQDMLGAMAQKHTVPVIYANQFGGNDELIFDGRSCALAPDGALLARAPGFEQAVLIVDTDATTTIAEDDFSRESETWHALVLGTRDYVRKSGFSKVIIGLSGGIDSAVTATVATYALGPENVTCVLMPSPYSSPGSIDDSLALANNLGVKTLTLPIEPIMAQFTETLAPSFAGYPPDTTEENIQSRIRGNLLMALSNKYGALLLTTGNKSELAVGYCTIYGDMAGGYAVISDVDKTGVFALARWYNKHIAPNIPKAIITKPPSAELRPGQKDEDSLPPYDILDGILALHVEQHQSFEQIVAAGYEKDVVKKVLGLVRFAEFKRRQAAPGIQLTPCSFGPGWRIPLACKRGL